MHLIDCCTYVQATMHMHTTIYGLLLEVNMREQLTKFENDGVTVFLEWDELNPMYSVYVTIIPETQQVNFSSSTVQLTVAYNMMYNVSVIISRHPCGHNSVTIFSEVFYYLCINACEYSVNSSLPNTIITILACAMWLLRCTRYCVCDTDPPCRAHVHIMFTIIQFLRVRANIHTVLEG